jgi:hypothetical protein
MSSLTASQDVLLLHAALDEDFTLGGRNQSVTVANLMHMLHAPIFGGIP